MDDLIGRKAAIDQLHQAYNLLDAERRLEDMPSAQAEITDEQAIEHLQASGWMQNHDKQMCEMGLRERLYDALFPSAQPDNDMIHLQKEQAYLQGWEEGREALRKKQRWTPIKVRPMDDEERKEWSERIGYDIEYDEAVMFDCPMPDDGQEVWVCSKCGNVWQDTCRIDEGIYLEENGDWLDIVAWMPYEEPEAYREEGDRKWKG